MKYLFIFGRNPELSFAEVISWFARKNMKVENYSLKKNCVIIETDEIVESGVIDELGGIIGIGQVICEIKDIERTGIYFGEKNNFSFILWDFSSETDSIRVYLKSRFKQEKLKASEKHFEGIKSSSKTLDIEYFVFDNYFGVVNQTNDYEAIEKRDMEKPVRREELAISPRLAKIMINLSEIKEKEILVDPFCGIGVILQEALLQDLKVIGVDKDKEAIKGCVENLQWFNFDKSKYHLIKEDSSKVSLSKGNVIVSEPDLGNVLKKKPSGQQANKIIGDFEHLMVDVLLNLKKNISGKIVFTAPLFRIAGKRISCNGEKIAEKTSLKFVKDFEDFRETQIVGRKIVVLEKY